MTIYLFTYETEDFPSGHKAFTSLQAAKDYLHKEIGEFITYCAEQEEYQLLHDFVRNATTYEEKVDNPIYCFEAGDKAFYIEELEVEG